MKQFSLLMTLALAILLPSCGGNTCCKKTCETKPATESSTTEVVKQERTSGVFQDDIDFDMDDFNEDLK